MFDSVYVGQLAVVAIALAAAVAGLLIKARGRAAAVLALLLFTLIAGAGWSLHRALARRVTSSIELTHAIPDQSLAREGFVRSDSCRACHPAQYHSWHASFHRTMTQPASRASVISDFDRVDLASRGRAYRLTTRDDQHWVNMVDPDWEHDRIAENVHPNQFPNPPRVDRRIVMTTGSHHMQTYWVASARDGRLFNLPWVWLREEARWAPREDVFLRPPNAGRMFSTWHDNCIECHSVAGEFSLDGVGWSDDPEVAELGIACEACHGPGEEHIRVNRNPARRFRAGRDGAGDPTIINPARLSTRESTQICGQCHSINFFKTDALREGAHYCAGGNLFETRMVMRLNKEHLTELERDDWDRQQAHLAQQSETFIDERMWSDGMVRVSGREHNAMIESACFRTGDLSCLSCHSMHESAPNDQLRRDVNGNESCLQCHDSYRGAAAIARHTHHEPDSAGSDCMNCHMPHTTYGLLKAIRSHLIDSPSVQVELATGRPNACNLCHLDQSLRWSADHLREWYGHDDIELTTEQESIAAAVLWTLTGDANQRALAAWHYGWHDAQAASGREWMAPYLGHLLADPYAAVRFIAHRSLKTLPEYETFGFDFVGSSDHRSEARIRAIAAWMRHAHPPRAEVLIDENGELDRATLTALSQRRNDRPVDLRE